MEKSKILFIPTYMIVKKVKESYNNGDRKVGEIFKVHYHYDFKETEHSTEVYVYKDTCRDNENKDFYYFTRYEDKEGNHKLRPKSFNNYIKIDNSALALSLFGEVDD